MIAKIRQKKTCIGLVSVLSSPELMETLAASGWDYACIDHMFTSTDWDRTAHMVRAARAAGLSTLVRVEANPWITKGDPGKVAVECTRAQGIGVSGVMPSIYSAKELEAILETSKDWHRGIHVVRFHNDMGEFKRVEAEISDQTMVIPMLESQRTVAEFEEILSVDGLEAVILGISDLSRVLGRPFQYEHPDVWGMIDKVVSICERRGIVCGGNTGYAAQTPEQIASRIKRMVDHGIRFIDVQTDGALFQFFTKSILQATEAELGENLGM